MDTVIDCKSIATRCRKSGKFEVEKMLKVGMEVLMTDGTINTFIYNSPKYEVDLEMAFGEKYHTLTLRIPAQNPIIREGSWL